MVSQAYRSREDVRKYPENQRFLKCFMLVEVTGNRQSETRRQIVPTSDKSLWIVLLKGPGIVLSQSLPQIGSDINIELLSSRFGVAACT